MDTFEILAQNGDKGVIMSVFKLLVMAFLLFAIVGCGTFQKQIRVKMNGTLSPQSVKKIAIISPKDGSPIDHLIQIDLAKKLKLKNIEIVSREESDLIITVAVPTQVKSRDEHGKIIALTSLSAGLVSSIATYNVTGSRTQAFKGALAGAAVGAVIGYAVRDSSVKIKLDVVFTNNRTKEFEKTRIFSTAKQVHLLEDEGVKVLVDRLSSTITDYF